jgi:hypothetical protein
MFYARETIIDMDEGEYLISEDGKLVMYGGGILEPDSMEFGHAGVSLRCVFLEEVKDVFHF